MRSDASQPLPFSPVATRRLLATFLAVALGLLAAVLGVFDAAGLQGHQWRIVILLAALAALVPGPFVIRLATWLAGLGVALLILLAYTPLAGALLRQHIRRDPPPATPVDALVVLSARIDEDGHLSAQALDRLLTGAALHRRGIAPRLILSRVRYGALTSDADQRRVLSLLGPGVPVTIVDSVHGTRDEALRIRHREPGVRAIALVTSPSHTRRACRTFEKVGFHVVCLPSESRDLPVHALRAEESRLRAFRDWLYETLATALYRARGWL
ncbi:MAG TPA: YdcF family protein [Gemmatimonadaceae bacterium]|nr:YdcF family protein [Gemmatimonadaceae bacterium]